MSEKCYNKGCLAMYNPDENTCESCCYHPGEPVFHDVKKKWSCCDKYSTDFTEFLNIKGCTTGKHSNIKPIEPEKPKPLEIVESAQPTVLMIPKPAEKPRPPHTEPLQHIAIEVSPQLKTALEKLLSENPKLLKPSLDVTLGDLTIGTRCKNSGCKVTYTKSDEDSKLCLYHPGAAMFHEGLKFWTCCNQKTSDFDSFLKQVGCTTGRHNWTFEEAQATNLNLNIQHRQQNCRFDWFQSSGLITLTLYMKHILPETVSIMANQVYLVIRMQSGLEKKSFVQNFHLFGTIDPTASSVKLMSSKAEILLKKADSLSWARLEYCTKMNNNGNINENSKTEDVTTNGTMINA